jgi:sarcosine oxidase subunit alpha
MRLPPRPGEVIDRGDAFAFRWNGRDVEALRGDTIASALAAASERVLSRSFKYHRPRGIMTMSYLDPGCQVQVGAEPNVRAAHRLAEPGMDVRAQNVWPSLRFDLRAANGLLAPFLSAGFYYKTFMRPRFLWPRYQRVLRQMGTPGGRIGSEPPEAHFDKRHVHPDVLVVGGGPAGMAAAAAAAKAGARVLLAEQEHQLGGHLRWGGPAELARLALLRSELDRAGEVEILLDCVVTGRYDDNWIALLERGRADGGERLVKARANVLVVAPGLIERPYVFAGNDKPGVMLSSAARRLLNLYAVRPGTRAVVFSANAEGDAAAEDLAAAGVEVARVVDARRGERLQRATGRGRVRKVELGDGSRIAADLLVTAVGGTTPTALLNMAGETPVYDARAARYLPRSPSELPGNVLACGGILGDGSHDELREHACAVGREAARRATARAAELQRSNPRVQAAARPRPVDPPVAIPALPIEPHPELFRAASHGFVDFSEDVSSKEIFAAVAEGFTSMQLAKRFTTTTMGPAQGKLELANSIAVHAEASGRSIAETGTTTWRPPYAPISLGALAGRNFEPLRLSPMHGWHERNGATLMVAGQWLRPDHYGDPQAEVRNVRENVGLIDVTPLGKLDLRGPDTSRLLNLVYVNKWSKLAIGSVRYGVMCSEDGVVMDDGVTGRLDEDHYLMSTTSSGAAGVWQWLEEWLQTEHPDWRVDVTAVTSAFASINIAGPRSRELLARVVEDIDLDPEAFPYMRVRRGRIAGVRDCFAWRIGFTGELSFEIHVPASYGRFVWETLLEAGADLGIAPFGVEAQRIMRLEKGHFIVGQDTDGLTRGFSVGLDTLVKLDKPDFAGKPELVWQHELGSDVQLVALQTLDASLVPLEASQVVEPPGRIVGRITSSRFSPSLGRSICLAQLTSRLARPGTTVEVVLGDGRRAPARVMEHHAHFDPEGVRLRA